MSPARVYTTDFANCPDYQVVNFRKTFELEGSSETENPGGFDTAERIMLVYANTASQVKSTFPLGTPHPDFPNLRLAARTGLQVLHGGWMQVTLQYKGILLETLSEFGNLIFPTKTVDFASLSEKTFPGGTVLTGSGFNATETALPLRLNQLNPGFSIWFVADRRQVPYSVFSTPPAIAKPTDPTQGLFSLPANLVTRVYPYGWVLKNYSNENIPGTNVWFISWVFEWEFRLALG